MRKRMMPTGEEEGGDLHCCDPGQGGSCSSAVWAAWALEASHCWGPCFLPQRPCWLPCGSSSVGAYPGHPVPIPGALVLPLQLPALGAAARP